MAKVAFVGLGVMGYPMAGHLATKGGHDVTVFNRTAAKAEKWVAQFGGKRAPTPKEAAQGQEFVMACVGNDNDLREVMLGKDGIFAGVRDGTIVVDHTTASAEIARELYADAKARGFDFIDAPVSGGQAGAENGVLTVMYGSDAGPFAQAEKVIAAYARACNLGASGSGQLAKMVEAQICIARRAGSRRDFALCAGRTRRRKADRDHLQGAAQSHNEMRGIATRPWSRANSISVCRSIGCRKDLAIYLAEGRMATPACRLPLWSISFTRRVQAMGGRRWDTSQESGRAVAALESTAHSRESGDPASANNLGPRLREVFQAIQNARCRYADALGRLPPRSRTSGADR